MTPERWWNNRSPEIRARIERLNPNLFDPEGPSQGRRLRGWNPAHTAWHQRMLYDAIGKREFISNFGREAWDGIPRRHIYRDGRRKYVHRSAVLDNVWLNS